jgi:uncharacterized protein
VEVINFGNARLMKAHFIFYVENQTRSADFYTRALDLVPALNVPGMTEFVLNDGAILGLMPEAGIKRLLGSAINFPSGRDGSPRAELYLITVCAADCHARALSAGARELSPVQLRNWGHRVGYVADPDGHVLAFAERAEDSPNRHLT